MDRATRAYIKTQEALAGKDLASGRTGSARRRGRLITDAQRGGQAGTNAVVRRGSILRRNRRGGR
jgi:hypothetical protein